MACAVCAKTDYAPLYKGLVQCRQCGFVWADLTISENELKELYADNYFFGGEYRNYLEEEAPLRKDFKRNLGILLKFSKGGRLLELGSAYGFFLDMARSHFGEVSGVDMNPQASDYAKKTFGLDVRSGDFLEAKLPENNYETIVSWATLEHLQAPDQYVAKINKLLKPGGVFAFTTCDRDSFVPKLRGPKWRLIHPPTHVSYYSRATLERLLTRFGFDVIYTDYIGQNRSIDSVLYAIFCLIYNMPFLYRLAKKLGLTRGTFYLNTFDTVYMVARKKA
jgi:SAM-dependent methyltransferase